MNEISIFIDESGDFGEYQIHSPYYIVSIVFHEQKKDISALVSNLDKRLTYHNLNNNCIHTGPIVRKEEEYQNMSIKERRNILNTFTAFIKKCPITYKCFYIEKKHLEDEVEMASKLAKQISIFLKDKMQYLNEFDIIKVYYDNGQIELTKLLIGIFHTLFSNVEFNKVIPSEYKLFQAADLFCYFKLLSLKLENKTISENEIKFFEKPYNIFRNYIKQFAKLESK